MRLLVVEDEVKTGDYLRTGLTEAGFLVDLARNGLDGHHLAMTESFDLIVLDVMLPDVDGWRMIVSSGEILDTEPLHINESSLIVRVDKPVKQYFRELVELGYTHHVIAVSGDVTAQVEMFARQAGIHVDRL